MKTYKCDMCQNTYEECWSDEEAEKEAEEIFGKKPKDWKCGRSIVCDDCFEKIHPLKVENIDLLLKARANI